MASGTITFPTGTGNASWKSLTGRIVWSSSSNGSTANTSTVTTKLYAKTGTGGTTGKQWGGKVKVGSNSQHSFSSLSSSKTIDDSYVLLATYTDTVAHNDDGSCSITISGSVSGPSGTSLSGVTSSGSGTAVLDTIARQATILTAPNFTDEGNPTITYKNPAGSAVDKLEACICKSDGTTIYVPYREISKTGTSYTFNLTETERNTLRAAATTNTLTVSFVIKTTINGESVAPFSSVLKTLTIVNANPTLSPTIKDTNETTIALTGDESKLVKFYSNASITTGAVTYKNATIATQTISNGGSTPKITGSATYNAVTNSSFTCYIKDSRGNTATKTINLATENKWVEYVKLTCNTKPSNPTADGNMTLNINGNYFNNSFGVSDNTLTLQYRMTVEGTDFGDWITVEPTLSGNTYNIDIPITDLDYKSTYVFEVQASDLLENLPAKSFSIQTTPIYDWSDEDFQFNVPVQIDGSVAITGNISANDISGWINSNVKNLPSGAGDRSYWNSLPNGTYWYNKDLTTITEFMPYDYGFVYKIGTSNPGDFSVLFYSQPSGKVWRKCGSSVDVTDWKSLVYTSDLYPVGTCYTTISNTNPSTLGMPGTWELIDKEFTPVYQDGGFTVSSTNVSAGYFKWSRAGHTITLENRWVTNVATTDSTIEVGSWVLATLGVSALARTLKFVSWSDGGEAISFCQINTTGAMVTYDTLPASTNTSGLASGIEFNGTISVVIPHTLMLDSACNKFVWKRTK